MSMTNTQVLTKGTPVICSECGTGTYKCIDVYTVQCRHCGKRPHLNMDIRPYLDSDETLTSDDAGTLYIVSRDDMEG